jgi:hypothetical protein
VVDAELSQAFQTKLAATKVGAIEVAARSSEAVFVVLLEPQLASTSNAVITAPRVNLRVFRERDFIVSA